MMVLMENLKNSHQEQLVYRQDKLFTLYMILKLKDFQKIVNKFMEIILKIVLL